MGTAPSPRRRDHRDGRLVVEVRRSAAGRAHHGRAKPEQYDGAGHVAHRPDACAPGHRQRRCDAGAQRLGWRLPRHPGRGRPSHSEHVEPGTAAGRVGARSVRRPGPRQRGGTRAAAIAGCWLARRPHLGRCRYGKPLYELSWVRAVASDRKKRCGVTRADFRTDWSTGPGGLSVAGELRAGARKRCRSRGAPSAINLSMRWWR